MDRLNPPAYDGLQYSSPGKLLLTGEYAVLKGARALVVPIKLRQTLSVTEHNSGFIYWSSFYNGSVFFQTTLKVSDLSSINLLPSPRELFIIKLLTAARTLNPTFLTGNGYSITTVLEANPEWGFGSSAQLTVNIARLANITPWDLHKSVSKGSGADVICSESETPILFKTDNNTYSATPIEFNPSFLNDLILIYTGHKQDSAKGVDSFLSKETINDSIISKIDALSIEAANAKEKKEFIEIMTSHERFLSDELKTPPASQKWFKGFNGALKSLGAWGGDYIMAVPYGDCEEALEWFRQKTDHPIFLLSELILNNKRGE